MKKIKTIGLVAHDACKNDMSEWVREHALKLAPHSLYCTGTTGRLVQAVFDLEFARCGVKVKRLKSGPLGGDQQMGALIAEDRVDVLFFFTDPMTMQPHDVDVKALMRISAIANIVVACTRATADFVISSPLFDQDYEGERDEHDDYLSREV